MPNEARDSYAFAAGKFRPHGHVEIGPVGEIITLHVSGPFNLEGVLAVNRTRMDMLAHQPPAGPYAHLTHCFGSLLISPEALVAFQTGLQEAYSRYLPPVAAAWVAHGEVEGYDLLASHFEGPVRATGTEVRHFRDPREAEAWLHEMLDRVNTAGA